MSLKKDIVKRVTIVYVAMLLFGAAIIGKIVYLQVVKGSYWREKASAVTVRDITIQPNRGDIFAEGNKLLATSVPYYEIRMDLRARGLTNALFAQNIDSLSIRLSRLFRNKSAAAYKNELMQARRENRRFHLIRRGVNYNQLERLRTFPLFRLGRNKGGLIVIQDNRRIQPQGNLASRTIGYTTKDEAGNFVGIEGAYDHVLRGRAGIRFMQSISSDSGTTINDENEVEPSDGLDILTTINVEIQDVATKALMEQLQKHNAHHGTAILMEVETGAIRAIANLERNSSGGYSETFNFAIGESLEPGSTFKLPVILAAIEHGHIELTDSIDTGKGTIKFFDQRINDVREGGFGKITVQEAFEVSSNVAIAKIIDRYYNGKEKRFINALYDMNLHKPLGLDIRGEANPEIKFPGDKFWSGVTLPMMSIGYEVRLTPLQILTFYNAIANDGKMVKPKFVSAIKQHGNIVKTFPTEVILNSVVSRSTVRKAKQLLEGVVERGTAMNLRNSVYKIAGKTGTAQIARGRYGYRHESFVNHQASFVGYFPADNPKYSCIVVVNSPSNNVFFGNLVAGPVFKEIADRVYATSLDMHEAINRRRNKTEPEAPFSKSGYREDLKTVFNKFNIDIYDNSQETAWVSTSSGETGVKLIDRKVIDNLVPNVTDMAIKDAVYILENAGLRVSFRGRGTVRRQSISPGTRIRQGDRITLELSMSN